LSEWLIASQNEAKLLRFTSQVRWLDQACWLVLFCWCQTPLCNEDARVKLGDINRLIKALGESITFLKVLDFKGTLQEVPNKINEESFISFYCV
jgi:hypothetical protein